MEFANANLMTIQFRKINFKFVQFLQEPSPLLLNSFSVLLQELTSDSSYIDLLL